MKKIILNTINILILLVFISCSNDDDVAKTLSPNDTKTYTPVIRGSIGEPKDINNATTKTGVIEDNPNHKTEGELFYWADGDKVKMLFFKDGDLDSTPTELLYKANIEQEGSKPKSCEFVTEGSLLAGDYVVYALYPADGWSKDENGYKATMPDSFFQNDASSEHLGEGMFMKAKSTVTISEGGDNSLNFAFQHLTALVRLNITNTGSNDYEYIANGEILFTDEPNTFYTEAYLDGGIDGVSLKPTLTSKVKKIRVDTFQPLGIGKTASIFFPILPNGNIAVRISFSYMRMSDSSNPSYTIMMTALPFLDNGFKAGNSYYFNFNNY